MTKVVSVRRFVFGIALGAIAGIVILYAVKGGSASATRAPTGSVQLRKTALGSVLVDARGRTLYLFEKDRNGVSACKSACVRYWPPLTSHGTPRPGSGVRQSLLRLGRQGQVLYAGHPLYTFVGDQRAGQTSGEGLTNFGADWYVLAASGQKIEPSASSGSRAGSNGGYSSGGGY